MMPCLLLGRFGFRHGGLLLAASQALGRRTLKFKL
jgi:hypothetical protein